MPNGADKKLNFVAKVYDPAAKEFKPIYIAPDATDKVQGDVKLSDATDSTLNAAEGMTAATPAAVKEVQDNANKKLDKETTSAQTVKSAVTFSGLVTGSAAAPYPTFSCSQTSPTPWEPRQTTSWAPMPRASAAARRRRAVSSYWFAALSCPSNSSPCF